MLNPLNLIFGLLRSVREKYQKFAETNFFLQVLKLIVETIKEKNDS